MDNIPASSGLVSKVEFPNKDTMGFWLQLADYGRSVPILMPASGESKFYRTPFSRV